MTRFVRLLAAGTLVLPLSACSLWAPQTTQAIYAAGDGLNADYQDVWIRNLVVVGQDPDGPGVLSGVLLNRTDQQVDVQLQAGDGALDATISVPPGATVTLTAPAYAASGIGAGIGERQSAVLDPVGVAPGDTLAVTVTTPAAGSASLDPPVRRAGGQYAGFLDGLPGASPTAASGAPTPGPSPEVSPDPALATATPATDVPGEASAATSAQSATP